MVNWLQRPPHLEVLYATRSSDAALSKGRTSYPLHLEVLYTTGSSDAALSKGRIKVAQELQKKKNETAQDFGGA